MQKMGNVSDPFTAPASTLRQPHPHMGHCPMGEERDFALRLGSNRGGVEMDWRLGQ